MECLDQLLESLLFDGRVAFRGRPRPASAPDRTIGVLRRAYHAYRLEVAGPPIALEEATACEAAEVAIQACWALVCREEAVPELARRLTMSHAPASPSHHLSADLVFHFLPQIHRRARAIDRDDSLPTLLEDLLRRWPLSGVLADLEGGPTTTPDLGGHEGLMLLYAERWARHENPAWRPVGRSHEYVELVLGHPTRVRPDPRATRIQRHG